MNDNTKKINKEDSKDMPELSLKAKQEMATQATAVIIAAIEIAQSRGAFKLEESANIFNAIQTIKTNG